MVSVLIITEIFSYLSCLFRFPSVVEISRLSRLKAPNLSLVDYVLFLSRIDPYYHASPNVICSAI
jgi:hypothetical protein